MNKKNTKKYNKRILQNNIVMLPSRLTEIRFINGERYMYSLSKPKLVGEEIVIANHRRGIYGTITSYIKARVVSVKRIRANNEERWSMKIKSMNYTVHEG